MIKNGLIQKDNIYGVPFSIDLIPKRNKTSRPGYKLDATTITIHETGNEKQSANARMHTSYVDNTKNYVSWHFTVDDKEIIQELPIIENAWHAGDGGKGPGNRTSIAIEICVNKDGDFEVAKENAIALINYLTEQLPKIKKIVPHQHWSGKNCPRKILKSGWENFLTQIENYKAPEKVKKYPVPDWAQDSMAWAVKAGINDGIIQSPEEVQFTHMIYKYHQAVKNGKI